MAQQQDEGQEHSTSHLLQAIATAYHTPYAHSQSL